MGITAAIINAGLGDLSLGLEMSGIKVVAAYETDKRAIEIHKTNLDVPIYPLSSSEIDIKEFPQVDLLSARLYLPLFSRAMSIPQKDCDPAAHILREILKEHKPRAFFLLANSSAKQGSQFQEFLREIAGYEYQFQWKVISVGQTLGVPVNECMVCVVGTLRETRGLVHFAEHRYLPSMPPESYYF